MNRLLGCLMLLTTTAPLAVAGEFGCPQCRTCGGACVLKAEPVTEDEICYEIECKDVCIPAVRFPWQSCNTPKCGRVRLVNRLKREKRETKGCKYEWVVVCPRCGRGDATMARFSEPRPSGSGCETFIAEEPLPYGRGSEDGSGFASARSSTR